MSCYYNDTIHWTWYFTLRTYTNLHSCRLRNGANIASTTVNMGRGKLKCDGTCTETRFHLLAKQTSSLKSAGASVQSNTGSQGVHISGSNAGYTMFRSSVKGTGYPLQPPVSPSLTLPCVTMCHHISTRVYYLSTVNNEYDHGVQSSSKI
jgi:hypothetical protein